MRVLHNITRCRKALITLIATTYVIFRLNYSLALPRGPLYVGSAYIVVPTHI
jgi:hypothetical protein